jgi:hypothetical protein
MSRHSGHGTEERLGLVAANHVCISFSVRCLNSTGPPPFSPILSVPVANICSAENAGSVAAASAGGSALSERTP